MDRVDRVLDVMQSRGLMANDADAQAVIAAIREPTEATAAENERLRGALTQIAVVAERDWEDFHEPHNGLPDFCRAILAGRRVRWPGYR